VRSAFGRCAALGLLLISSAARVSAQTDVTVQLDARPRRATAPENRLAPTALLPWENWAGARSLALTRLEVVPDRMDEAVGWADHAGRAGLEFVNHQAQTERVRIVVQLPGGLWRVDAALVPGAVDANGVTPAALPHTPTALWRMESAMLPDDGALTKSVSVPAGGALFLRWVETGAAALDARKAVQHALWATDNSALQDRVSGALMPVSDTLDILPILVGRGDRAKITRRIHTALLATAKAQALWENGNGTALTARDAPFAALVTALSEISCAAFNLVPEQAIVPSTHGGSDIRVTLTNAGGRSVGLVALGIEHRDGGPSSDLTVFRSLGPGATVAARFPAADPSGVRGIVQFISDMGAATVPAAPEPPAADSAGPAAESANP
jgi:hypothetical protein